MSNEPSLRTSTIVTHPEHGKGVIICNYTEDDIDMVDVHWQCLNIIMEHRAESLRKQLTGTTPPATNAISPWAALAEEK